MRISVGVTSTSAASLETSQTRWFCFITFYFANSKVSELDFVAAHLEIFGGNILAGEATGPDLFVAFTARGSSEHLRRYNSADS